MGHKFPAPGTHQCGLAWDGTWLWHSDGVSEMIYALDPATGEVRDQVPCPGVRTGLTWTGDALVQVVDQPKRLCYLRRTGEIVGYRALTPPSNRFCGIEAGDDGLWLGLERPGVIQQRHPDTLEILRTIQVEGEVAGVTWVPGRVVYACYEDGLIRSIETGTGTLVGKRKVAGSPTGITWDGSGLWYCDFDAKEICLIDPDGLI